MPRAREIVVGLLALASVLALGLRAGVFLLPLGLPRSLAGGGAAVGVLALALNLALPVPACRQVSRR